MSAAAADISQSKIIAPLNTSESHLNTKLHASTSQSSPKKRQGFVLRSLKDSLKFKGSSSHKKNGSTEGRVAEVSRSSKIRSGTTSKEDLRKAKHRSSAQRVSLFRYEKVKAMSCLVDGSSRRGSESSTSTVTTTSGDTTSDISAQTRNSVKFKPTTIISSGVLEVYQISTPNLNPQENTQEMNYLSLGRKDNIVHPILPRLQVSKLGKSGQKFLISFGKPERYWEIEFLPFKDLKNMSEAVQEFETVMSKICRYSTIQEHRHTLAEIGVNSHKSQSISSNQITSKPLSTHVDLKQEDSSDEDDDDLYYLLVDENSINDSPREETLVRPLNNKEGDDTINEAFKRALQNVKPSVTQRIQSYERNIGSVHSVRRFSSYQSIPRYSFEPSINFSKRFSSVAFEANVE